MSYDNWAPSEPGTNPKETCVRIELKDKKWHDVVPTDAIHYLCEGKIIYIVVLLDHYFNINDVIYTLAPKLCKYGRK